MVRGITLCILIIVLLIGSTQVAHAIGLNIMWNLFNYDTGDYEYYNYYPGYGYHLFGSTTDGSPVPYGSNETFWLWGFAVSGATTYDLNIEIDTDLDERYFISMFDWRPDDFYLPYVRNNIPASSPLSLDTETHHFIGSASGTGYSSMLLLIRPELGYRWDRDLSFTLSAGNLPSGGGGIGAVTIIKNSATIPVGAEPVPEPTALVLFATGIVGVTLLRRHKK